MNPTLKTLMNSANFDPSKERKEIPLKVLLSQIDEGQIVLPIFQTYIRWTLDKAVKLFNFQLSGKAAVAPISMNLIDDPNQVIEQISFLNREILNNDDLIGKQSIADGQQRLATNYKAFINHEDFKRLVLDLKKGRFLALGEGDQIERHQIPVGVLYNKEFDFYLQYVNANSYLKKDDVKDVLSTIRKKHEQYYYAVNYAMNLSRDEQMDWFEKLNLAGSLVTHTMVYLTDLLVKGVDFYTEYVNPFGDLLDEFEMDALFPRKSAEISIPLATLNSSYYRVIGKEKTSNSSPIPSDAQPKAIGKCTADEIRLMINITLKSLRSTLELIDSDPTIKKPERIDIITYLVGLFVENDINRINAEQKCFVIEWIKSVNFLNNSNKERRNKYEDLLVGYRVLETK